MPSSDRLRRPPAIARRGLLLWASLMLAACSAPPSPAQFAALPTCASQGAATAPEAAAALAALRRSVEEGPLFEAVATGSDGVATCRVNQDSGAMALDYQFRNGSGLRVKRDPAIEHTEQEARFASPPVQPPEAVLARAERAAFGASGCGIDWVRPETRAGEAGFSATETVFRGDVCNCRASVGRDAAGRVVGLALRSTC